MILVDENCTGCTACSSICPKNSISMIDNGEGFLYPQVDKDTCIDCGLCEKVCPLINPPVVSSDTKSFGVKNRDIEERKRSASGGVFPLLANLIINQGGLVYGAAYDKNFDVEHISISDIESISKLQSAKYSQSKLGNCFRAVHKELNNGKLVLFSGTPCQCSGLKTFLGRDYKNLILVDLVCHGVPSPKVWQTYIDYRAMTENDGKRPLRINLRSKKSGWSYYKYSTEFDYGNGQKTYIYSDKDLFMRAFIGNICLRKSCSCCHAKGVNRCSDLTLGDYWGVWDQYPDLDDNYGTSLVLVHTEKGESLINKLLGQVDLLNVNLENAINSNASIYLNSHQHSNRDQFLKQVNAERFRKLVVDGPYGKRVIKPKMDYIKTKVRELYILFKCKGS